MTKRPWGRMWKLFHTKKKWLKFIHVRGRTNLQAHRYRSEWHLGLYKVEPLQKYQLLRGDYFEFASGEEANEDDVIKYGDNYERSLLTPK